MSTRGGIGYVEGDRQIRFVYQHFDSYLEGLGNTLLRQYRAMGGDLSRMRREAVDDHTGGWSVYPERCYCHESTRQNEGDMVSECRCPVGDYTHCDALFIEWLYVLNARGLDVYKSVPSGQTQTLAGWKGTTYESPLYRHIFVGTLSWDASEDDVDNLAMRADEIREAEWEAHGRSTVS